MKIQSVSGWFRSRPPSQPSQAKAEAGPQDRVETSAFTAPAATPESEFRETFFREYAARYCGKNIQRFVTRMQSDDAAQANVLTIRNEGGSWFGLVRALKARDARDTPDGVQLFENDRNWEFHVVLEHQGKIFDFDYGIQPKVVPVEEYFHTMYLAGDAHVPAQRKLDGYSIKVTPAKEFGGTDAPSETRSLAQYLSGWGVNLQQYAVPSDHAPASNPAAAGT